MRLSGGKRKLGRRDHLILLAILVTAVVAAMATAWVISAVVSYALVRVMAVYA